MRIDSHTVIITTESCFDLAVYHTCMVNVSEYWSFAFLILCYCCGKRHESKKGKGAGFIVWYQV